MTENAAAAFWKALSNVEEGIQDEGADLDELIGDVTQRTQGQFEGME